MAKILIDKNILRAVPGKYVRRLRDRLVKGFHLVITPAGGKSWALAYTSPETGKRRTLTLGHYPALSLQTARLMAQATRERIEADRIDPAEEAKREQLAMTDEQAEAMATSVDALFDVYLADMNQEGKVSAANVRQLFRRDIQPVIGTMRARDVTRDHVADIIATVADRGALIQANRVRSYLRAAFTFGLDVHTHPRWRRKAPDFRIPFNPVADVRRAIRQEPVGQRYLSKDEVNILWNRIGVEAMSVDLALAIKLLLATGQRVEEVLHATWSEFDLGEMTWTIPGERRKNRHKTIEPHIVPLTTFHADLLAELRQYTGDSRWLFPHTDGTRPRNANALLQGVRRFCEPKGISQRESFDRFTPRDLRRTWKTLAGSIGISLELRNRIQGHAFQDVGSRNYDRWDYLEEKRTAMERWTQMLGDIITENETSNVIELKHQLTQ